MKTLEIGIAIPIATMTPIAERIMLVACVPSVDTVQFLDIVEKFRAGQNTQVTSLETTLPASRGTISVFLVVKPTAMHINIVSIGVRVAKNASIIGFLDSLRLSFL